MTAVPPKRALASTLVFVAVFVVYAASPVRQTKSDPRWVLPTAESLLLHGDADLDEYPAAADAGDYRLARFNGHVYSAFPAGTSILCVPFVALAEGYERLAHGESYEEVLKTSVRSRFDSLLASFFVALTAALLYLTVDLRLKSVWRSLLLVAVFAFCTTAWSVASRALWQHGPSMLLLTAALYAFLRAEERPGLLFWAGLALAFSCVVRPTNVVSVAALSALVLARHRRGALSYFIALALVGVLFVDFNVMMYGTLLPDYFSPGRIGFHEHFAEALAGNLISPSRGLFIFSPALLFAFVIRRRCFGALEATLAAIVALHWVVISSFAHWWGGYSFGPRLFADVMPFFVFLMVPAVDALRPPWTRLATAGLVLFAILAAFSVFVHFRGATHGGCDRWNRLPVSVDERPARVWDWSDPQFLR